jgi:hypothetical protein
MCCPFCDRYTQFVTHFCYTGVTRGGRVKKRHNVATKDESIWKKRYTNDGVRECDTMQQVHFLFR